MTKQSEVKDDGNYKVVHNAGFVGLVDTMGSDSDITQAARVSYGTGTKKVSDDRNLIRYLMRHRHTTPFEMCEVKFHIRLPIFIMRQWIRHRTASVNEYSARYSIMEDEFYIPEHDYLQFQSRDNKQGRCRPWMAEGMEDGFEYREKELIRNGMDEININSYKKYEKLLDMNLTRELSRIVLPVSNYTEFYWKINLHNLFHFLHLRTDSHAQQEIQDYANAVLELARPKFPVAFEAWENYVRGSVTFSQTEMKILKSHMATGISEYLNSKSEEGRNPLENELSNREWKEFTEKLKNESTN
tara:strand:+ start:2650 stop:3549 length:900 start_codon:yes stop_codon:yes gene_type:complete